MGNDVGAQTEPDGYVERRGRMATVASSSFTLLILLALIAVFAVLEGTKFFNPTNAQNIAIDASQLLLLAVGVTFVIITAGIDLSVGSVLVLSAVVAAKVMAGVSTTPELGRQGEWPDQNIGIPLGFAAGIGTGLLCGLINGFLVTRLRMPSFIVTLGTLGIALGVAQVVSNGVSIANVPQDVQLEFGLREIVGFDWGRHRIKLTPPLLIAAIVVVIASTALTRTRFGRYTFAIGSNANAARRVGINVDRHLLKVYGVSGLLAGVAGCLDLLRFGNASVSTHQNDNLAAISAAVIGGTSLFGGLGSIVGTVIGAFIPAVLRNGLIISGVKPFWQNVTIGMILILAVYLDQRRRAAEERM